MRAVQSVGGDRTAVLVIRIWVEGEPAHRVRARITSTHDVTLRDDVQMAAASRREIEEILQAWLDQFGQDAFGGGAW
jgi:hypothetical protein